MVGGASAMQMKPLSWEQAGICHAGETVKCLCIAYANYWPVGCTTQPLVLAGTGGAPGLTSLQKVFLSAIHLLSRRMLRRVSSAFSTSCRNSSSWHSHDSCGRFSRCSRAQSQPRQCNCPHGDHELDAASRWCTMPQHRVLVGTDTVRCVAQRCQPGCAVRTRQSCTRPSPGLTSAHSCSASGSQASSSSASAR